MTRLFVCSVLLSGASLELSGIQLLRKPKAESEKPYAPWIVVSTIVTIKLTIAATGVKPALLGIMVAPEQKEIGA